MQQNLVPLSLTAEQQILVKEQRIEGEKTPDAWLALLAPLTRFDRETRAVREKARARFAIMLVGVVSGLILTIALPPIGIILLLAALTGAIIAGRKLFSIQAVNLAKNLHEFILPLLALLREDMPRDQALRLRLDLRGAAIKEKQVREDQPHSSGAYHRIVDTHYVDPWMEGEGTLADGARLQWKIEDYICKSTKTKRTPRGKIKSKAKINQRTHLFVQVGLPEKLYNVASGRSLAAPGAKIAVKPGEKRSTVKLHRVLKSSGAAALQPAQFMDLVGQAYRNAVPNATNGGK